MTDRDFFSKADFYVDRKGDRKIRESKNMMREEYLNMRNIGCAERSFVYGYCRKSEIK